MTILTHEHWAKIRQNNRNLREFIDKIEITGITAAQYEKKFPKLARLIKLEEVIKMKLAKQSIVSSHDKKEKVAKVLVPEGSITPRF